jgi:solute carrier family 13 (sodium-dependent dicarboxylate transporter), member 2/3/5
MSTDQLSEAERPSQKIIPTSVKSRYGRVVTLLIIILLGLWGYWLAPDDLTPGVYDVDFQVTLPDGSLLTAHDRFTLGQEQAEPTTTTTPAKAYTVIVEAPTTVAHRLEQRLVYHLQVEDGSGRPVLLALDDATSLITGPGDYEQTVPPTEVDNGRLTFTMRLPYKADIALALLLVVAGLWLTELIPLSAAALLIPVMAVVTGITGETAVLAPFAHPIIMLFLAGFLMAQAMKQTGLDRWLALTILSRSSLKPAFLMLTLMCLTAFLSMWMSNTASVALVLPIALAVSERMPEAVGRTAFRRALVLSVAYAASIGGVGSAIGTPANMLALTFLNQYAGSSLSFVDWFRYGLPMVILMLPIIWLYLLFAFGVQLRQAGTAAGHDLYRRELGELGPLTSAQRRLLFVFLVVITLWLTEAWHELPTAIVALGGALILFWEGVINQQSFNQINWDALLTFGGGLAIGAILVSTGVSDWVALQLAGLANYPPLLVIFLVAGLTLITGAFISNTACAAMLIPLAIPLAQFLQLDPRLLVMIIAIGSSIDFALVVGTPPTMMAYATGLFSVKEIFRRGIILDLIGLLLLSFGITWIWRWLGVVTL